MASELKGLIDRLNPICRAALEAGAKRAVGLTNQSVEVEHFLLDLISYPDTDLRALLRHYDVELATLEAELTQAIETFARGSGRTPSFAPQLPRLLRKAWMVSSLDSGEGAIRSGAILQALLEDASLAEEVCTRAPVLSALEAKRVAADLRDVLAHTAEAETAPAESAPKTAATRAAPGEALAAYTSDLTAAAEAGKLDVVIGREQEIAQTTDVLLRRRQNNPILLGEPGVGKTAVVEGLAQRIAKGDVPEAMRRMRLHALDLNLLQAGASVRGEFERRLKALVAEVTASPRPIILFVDEAHSLIGAGGAEGQGDAANLLKPALARGELRMIGATTWREYKKYIEKDPALSRRFQAVKVPEPTPEQAVAVLRGLAETLEAHHGVRIEEAALSAAVALSDRYIPSRKLPDKAISVLDTACARVALSQGSNPPVLAEMERDCAMLDAEIARLEHEERLGGDHGETLERARARRQALAGETEALRTRCGEEAGRIVELAALERIGAERALTQAERAEVLRLRGSFQPEAGPRLRLTHVDGAAVAAVIASWTGVPVDKLAQGDMLAARSLREGLGAAIIGQPHAVESVADRIEAAAARLTDPERPTGVFLLVGPTGVGKTETALAVADLMFGGRQAIVNINMTEYQEAHSVAGLKGAPPGYVGYGTGGLMTEAVRRTPYTVLLLDEFEKAHPDVWELFYRVFDTGGLEDSEGQLADFRHSVVFATTNAAQEAIEACCAKGRPEPEALVEAVYPELQRIFRPALLERMTVVPYYPLDSGSVETIARMKLAKLAERVTQAHGLPCTFTQAAVAAVRDTAAAQAGRGARVIDRIVNAEILPRLSTALLKELSEGTRPAAVRVGVEAGRFEVRFE